MEKNNGRKKDQYTAVSEKNMRSDFRSLGESLELVRQETKQNSVKLASIQNDLEFVKSELAIIPTQYTIR